MPNMTRERGANPMQEIWITLHELCNIELLAGRVLSSMTETSAGRPLAHSLYDVIVYV